MYDVRLCWFIAQRRLPVPWQVAGFIFAAVVLAVTPAAAVPSSPLELSSATMDSSNGARCAYIGQVNFPNVIDRNVVGQGGPGNAFPPGAERGAQPRAGHLYCQPLPPTLLLSQQPGRIPSPGAAPAYGIGQ